MPILIPEPGGAAQAEKTGAEEEGGRAAKEEGGQARALPLLQGRYQEDGLRQLHQASTGATSRRHGWQPCLPYLQVWLPAGLL